jgi:hypothetical protein
MRKISIVILFLMVISILIVSCSSGGSPAAPAAGSSGSETTAIDGKTLLETRCTACHSLDRIKSKSATAEQWQSTVDRMIQGGAKLSKEEAVVLVKYLAENYK